MRAVEAFPATARQPIGRLGEHLKLTRALPVSHRVGRHVGPCHRWQAGIPHRRGTL